MQKRLSGGSLSRAFLLSASLLPLSAGAAHAQAASTDGGVKMPPIVITEPAGFDVAPGTRETSLTVPSTAEAAADIETTPGGVDLVPDTEYKATTPSVTLKDALDFVPGVFVQPKWGEDSRLSIRGSGLSRNFHLRGLQLYMDGIPINTADGFGDFQEIDPTAYRYIEVYRGANALRFGVNSLGGAINFVTPSGYDADLFGGRIDVGSFDFRKVALSSGGVAGPIDAFANLTWQSQDGFREHSDGESVRGSANLGVRLAEDLETRFYVNANDVEQRIPGAVTKAQALSDPEDAAASNIALDQQRNIETLRLANKSTLRLGEDTLAEFGLFYLDRHLDHPISIYIDYDYEEYGAFARVTDERELFGFRNRLIVGANLHNGVTDAKLFSNTGDATKGNKFSDNKQTSENIGFYAENSFYLLDTVALVAGVQYLDAEREQKNRLSGVTVSQDFSEWSPKIGILWDVTPTAQIFANVSRAVEVPSFGENTVGSSPFEADAQEAVTYEIGTRGAVPGFRWDMSIYRAEIDNELQCLNTGVSTTTCTVSNADSTVHQGVELGLGATLARGLLVSGTADALDANAAYTYSDFFFDGDETWGDNELPGAPPHYLRAELVYSHPSGISLGPDVEWVPEAYYVDNANTFETEDYAIFGLTVGYAGDAFSAYVKGTNLFDEEYIASSQIRGNVGGLDGAYFEPGNGRAIYGGIQVKW